MWVKTRLTMIIGGVEAWTPRFCLMKPPRRSASSRIPSGTSPAECEKRKAFVLGLQIRYSDFASKVRGLSHGPSGRACADSFTRVKRTPVFSRCAPERQKQGCRRASTTSWPPLMERFATYSKTLTK